MRTTAQRQAAVRAESLTRATFREVEDAQRRADDYRRPISVRESQILREQRARTALTLVEGGAAPECAHDGEISVVRVIGSTLSGDEPSYGVCKACGEWVVRDVVSGSDEPETRPMTDAERAQAQKYEDETRLYEWCEDYQAGDHS